MITRRNYVEGAIFTLALLVMLLLGSIGILMWVGSLSSKAAAETLLARNPVGDISSTRTPSVTPVEGCVPGVWSIIPSPNQMGANILTGVASVSANDVWAVGGYFVDTVGVTQTLILHWNGSEWAQVASPNIGTDSNTLHDVTALSANDIWAVGEYFAGSPSAAQTLILHWDGSSWTSVVSPNVAGSGNYLSGVTAIAAADIWAVGSTLVEATGYSSLTMHYNGSQWSIVPSPNPSAGNNSLAAVVAVSSSRVYAVGGAQDTVAISWDGHSWTRVSTPDPGSISSTLYDVAVAPSGDVWAVGAYSDVSSLHTLILRNWAQVAGPTPSSFSRLYSISAVADNDMWAVGYYTPGVLLQTLTLHWNGAQWAVVRSPSTPWQAALYGVGVSPGRDLWAVGSSHDPGESLTMRYSGLPCDTLTSTPTPTARPTFIPTSTPTGIATQCPISFSDVRPTDWFYDSVRCLSCHGAISGYADHTFQPGNNTTRAQMCKIVVLAFAIPINTKGGPHYTDVAPRDPFYGFIETASNRGLISGYSDHTFRPGDNVTRGQLSKIVVNAAIVAYGWSLRNPQTPSFSDVHVTDPFYKYVETAICHVIIGGYADHTFLPANNATRAQISKIVCLAASNKPGCN